MRNNLIPRRRACALFQVGLVYVWLTNLAQTDSYYSVYVLCAVASIVCMLDNRAKEEVDEPPRGLALAAAAFSLAVLLANWTLFQPASMQAAFNAVCTGLGGWVVGAQGMLCLWRRLPLLPKREGPTHPARVFLGAFVSIAAIDLAYLFSTAYPGVLTTDSVSTIRQIVTGTYNNTMPFWHTMTVELFYRIGYGLFGEINAAIAFFHCVQVIFLAACVAFALTTVYQAGLPKWLTAVFYGMYAILPYSIVYSVTLWKDVLFGGAVLLFVTALYRILGNIGRSGKGNLVLLALGGGGRRTNGWYVFLVATAVMFLAARKRHKQVLVVMACVLGVGWGLLNPVLAWLDVEQTNLVEATAVPMQQLARVIANGRDLTQEEEALLSMAFHMEEVAEDYTPWSVDSIKFENFRYGNLDYIKEHLWEYGKLYLRLGLRYPGDYLTAWIEETKGYWNGGYDYWIYTRGVDANELGIVASGGDNGISHLFAALFRYLEKPDILQPLYSIGLCVWGLFACFLLNLWKKREELLLSVPGIVLVVGLWLGTPVYAEFRYAYPIFLTMPVILAATVFAPGKTACRA